MIVGRRFCGGEVKSWMTHDGERRSCDSVGGSRDEVAMWWVLDGGHVMGYMV